MARGHDVPNGDGDAAAIQMGDLDLEAGEGVRQVDGVAVDEVVAVAAVDRVRGLVQNEAEVPAGLPQHLIPLPFVRDARPLREEGAESGGGGGGGGAEFSPQRRGGGPGTQKFVYQKQPNQQFLL